MFEDVDIKFTEGVALICLAAIAMIAISYMTGVIHVSPSDLNIARFGVP